MILPLLWMALQCNNCGDSVEIIVISQGTNLSNINLYKWAFEYIVQEWEVKQ